MESRDHYFWILRGLIDLDENADDQKLIYFALKPVNCNFFFEKSFRNSLFRKFDSKGEFRMKNFVSKYFIQNKTVEPKISDTNLT